MALAARPGIGPVVLVPATPDAEVKCIAGGAGGREEFSYRDAGPASFYRIWRYRIVSADRCVRTKADRSQRPAS